MAYSLKKYFRRLFIFLLVAALLIAGSLLLLRYVYGDAVKQNLLAALNTRIQKEITVENIDIDVFGSFPYASLRLQNLQTVEADGKMLINAAQVNVLFNYMDMIKGRYEIERVYIRDAFIYLVHFQDGSVNYQLFKKPEDNPDDSNNLNILLKEVQLINVEVSYLHFPADQEYLFKINRGNVQGDFSQDNQQFKLSGDFFSTHIRSGKTTFFKEYELQLTLDIQLEDAGKLIQIKQSRVETSGLVFDMEGTINTSEGKRELDLQLLCSKSKLSDLMKIIPSAYLEPLKGFSLAGDVGFNSDFKGRFSGNHLPAINIDFWVDNGKLDLGLETGEFKNINLKGSFSNGKAKTESSFDLNINQVKATFDGGNLNGRLRIDNFIRPRISVAFSSTVDLARIKPLIRNEKLNAINGSMQIDMEFQNQLQDFRKFTLHDFISSKTSGTLKITDVTFELKNYPLTFDNFNGSFTFSNKDLLVKTFSGKVGENDFRMDGSFRNILAYAFLAEEPIYIDAGFESQYLDLESLLQTNKTSSSQGNQLFISPRLHFQLKVNIHSLRFRKFSATEVKGNLSQRKQVLQVDKATFNSMEGQVNLSGNIRVTKPDEYRINCDADVNGVNIQQLFYDFGNFGQDNITDKNLAGKVTAHVHYESGLTPGLKVDPASVYCLSNLIITNGELNNYAPMYKLSRFIQKDNLAHITFSEMKNKVEIKDETVYLPSMDISSNTLNLTLFGKHGFDNDIDYHLQLLLSDLIGNNTEAQEVPGENFVKDDELGKTKLFIHMTGNANDPLISYDTREVSKKVKEDLQAEQIELKELFQNTFKADKNPEEKLSDSLLIEKPDGKDFNIEWEEPDTLEIEKPESNRKKKKDKPAEQEFIIQWDEVKDTIR